MSLNDKAVMTPALGYVFAGVPGLIPPTPAELKTLDPLTYGSQVQKLKIVATGGTYTVSDGTDESDPLPYNSTAGSIQVAIESLGKIGPGNANVAPIDGSQGEFSVTYAGSLQGKSLPLSADDTDLVGASASAEFTVTTAPNGWQNIGHTSRDEMPEFGFDGGDSEVKGSWQNPSLREVVTEAAADYLILNLNQFDEGGLTLYYGPKSANSTPGVFGVEGSARTYERAFLVIIVDGDFRLGFTAPKSNVKRDDAISLPVDDFGYMPIKATFLKMGNRDKFQWINEDLF